VISKAQSVDEGSTMPSTDLPNTSDLSFERLRPILSLGFDATSDFALKQSKGK